MRDRDKAQDVFEKTDFVFGKKASFDEVFPTVADVRVVVREKGAGVWGLEGEVRHFGKTGEFINCSNPSCYNGGFSIGQVLRDMVRAGETVREDSAVCQGHEGSPKGRRIVRRCVNFFKYSVEVTYKPKT